MIVQALMQLRPGAKWQLDGNDYEGLTWSDQVQTKPTKQEVENKVAELLADFQSKEYQRKRQPEYPPLTELADALYHQQNGDETKMTAYLAKCEAVKQKYPKE